MPALRIGGSLHVAHELSARVVEAYHVVVDRFEAVGSKFGRCEVLVRSRDEVGVCPRLLPHSEVVDEGRIAKACKRGITSQSAKQPGHRVIELRQIAALTEGEVLCLGTFACV